MKKGLNILWSIITVIAIFTLSYILLDNVLKSLDNDEIALASLAITVIVTFLYNRVQKRKNEK